MRWCLVNSYHKTGILPRTHTRARTRTRPGMMRLSWFCLTAEVRRVNRKVTLCEALRRTLRNSAVKNLVRLVRAARKRKAV